MRKIVAVLRGFLFGAADGVLIFGLFTLAAFWLSRTVNISSLISFLFWLDGTGTFVVSNDAENAFSADQEFIQSIRRAAFLEGIIISMGMAIISTIVSILIRCGAGIMAIQIEDRVFARLSERNASQKKEKRDD